MLDPLNILNSRKYPTTNEEILELYKSIFPQQTKSTNQTIKNAWEDEEVFALRATDETSSVVILYWIRENFFTASEMKLRSAFEAAIKCKNQENKRRAD